MLSLRILALAMPLIFIAHVLEEAPRFVFWFNSLVNPPISQAAFLSVNATALAITIVVAVLVATVRDTLFGLVGVAWVGFLIRPPLNSCDVVTILIADAQHAEGLSISYPGVTRRYNLSFTNFRLGFSAFHTALNHLMVSNATLT